MLIKGACHCGNIAVEIDWPDDARDIPGRACGCSFCTKHGAVWTSHPRARLAVSIGDTNLVSRYEFGTRTARFHVCARCGGVPVVTSDIDGSTYAVVNVNAFENVDPARLVRSAANFESEEVASRLARRKRGWISNVRFSPSGPPR